MTTCFIRAIHGITTIDLCTYVCTYLLVIPIISPNIDTDECTHDTDGCEHNCNNTVGSFFCSCNTGYALTLDGKNCTGEWFATYIVT